MNFVEYVSDLELTLTSENYVESLWCKVRERICDISISLEDEEIYRNHLPVDLTKFLKRCVGKLRDMKHATDSESWSDLNPKYISTLVHFILEQENNTMQNALYAANIFVLLNTIHIPRKQFFYKVTYLKVLEVLGEFNRSQDITCTSIMYLMDDFKVMLLTVILPEDVVTSTIAVLHSYTYCCNDVFDKIDIGVSFENLGYLAFVSLKILACQLSRQKNNDRKLFPVLLSLMSTFKSSSTNNLSRSVKSAHLKNVQLFIKDNCNLFQSRTFCLITDALKIISLSSEYDDYESIAQFIQQLPIEINQAYTKFFVETMVCNKDDFKKNLLNLVLPILRHTPENETVNKRLVRAEIFLYNAVMLFADKNEGIRTLAIKIVAEYSEDSLGRRVLRKLMASDNYDDVNSDSIQDILYSITDQNWSKKVINVCYIQIMCTCFIIKKDIVTIKALNRLRDICIKGSPHDLRPCIIHLKRLLEYHANDSNVVTYVLSIFVKQIFDPMATSTLYAKELHEQIFSNITVNEEYNFVWNVINYLVSHNFDVCSLFEKFHSLQLLRQDSVRILMEYKIHETGCRTAALKLLCVMLNFIEYSKCHLLEEILEDWIISQNRRSRRRERRQHKQNGNNVNISPTDLCFVLSALTKIMQKKSRRNCTQADLDNFQQIRHLVCQAFFDQVFPIACVSNVITLLGVYSDLISEDEIWDRAACDRFEEQLVDKLNHVCSGSLEHHIYLLRDVMYVGELALMRKMKISDTTFVRLQQIATASAHTDTFSAYIKKHSEVWNLCLLLYIKCCFVNTELTQACAENLEFILSANLVEEVQKLQIMYALYDICAMHFQYFDPLIPFLFDALHDENAFIRFISSKIIMKLINEEQLRLMDGQYFVFMGLLADEKDIIAQNVEIFIKESFVKRNYQAISGQFVSCIIHYNFCYTHPAVSLSEHDQILLKKKSYSSSDRYNIYYNLFRHLPENMKLNILRHICNEILVRVLKETLPRTPDVFSALEDALNVILYFIPKDHIPDISDGISYYQNEVKYIHNNLLVPENTPTENKAAAEKNSVLKSLLIVLLRLLYSKISEESKFYQNILYTISVLRNEFETNIRCILDEDITLTSLFESLKKFFQKSRHHFQYSALSIGPNHWQNLVAKENVVFYWQNMTDFTYIPPCKIVRVDNR